MAEDNNYGIGREGRFDSNGIELPKLPTYGRSDGWGGTKLMTAQIPKATIISMAIEFKRVNGRLPTKALVPFSNIGCKSFGSIVENHGFMCFDVVYDSPELAVE